MSICLVTSSGFADIITFLVLSDRFMKEWVFFKMTSFWNEKRSFSSDFDFIKLIDFYLTYFQFLGSHDK